MDFYEDHWVSNATTPAKGESDTAHFEAMLRAHGITLPKAMAFVRFVHLTDSTRRKEMMIIYAEAFSPGETTKAAKEALMEEALSRRARMQISLRQQLGLAEGPMIGVVATSVQGASATFQCCET